MFGWFKKKTKQPPGPDFSRVDSQAKVLELFRRGELEKMFLMPLEFGGEDIPPNTMYVPIGLAEAKGQLDNGIIRPLVEQGQVTEYSATPEYQGDSHIPIAIEIRAGQIQATLNIWGEALAREQSG
jgi:hypothetical protein